MDLYYLDIINLSTADHEYLNKQQVHICLLKHLFGGFKPLFSMNAEKTHNRSTINGELKNITTLLDNEWKIERKEYNKNTLAWNIPVTSCHCVTVPVQRMILAFC